MKGCESDVINSTNKREHVVMLLDFILLFLIEIGEIRMIHARHSLLFVFIRRFAPDKAVVAFESGSAAVNRLTSIFAKLQNITDIFFSVQIL